MGHIKLYVPVSHIWFLRGVPSRMGLMLDKSSQQLEKVIYFSSYIITKVDEQARDRIMDAIEQEYKSKVKKEKTEAAKNEIKQAREKAKEELLDIKELKILSEVAYHNLSMKYGEVFEAGTGAEVVRNIFIKIDAQGFEQRILKGTENSFSRIGGFQLEMPFVKLYEDEFIFNELIEYLKIKGFTLAALEPGWSDPKSGRGIEVDGIFLKNEFL